MLKTFRITLFLSFFIQALIPVGFMPTFANDGMTIVICSGTSEKIIHIASDDISPNNKTDETSSKCSYAIGGYTTITPPEFIEINTSYILSNSKINDASYIQLIALIEPTRGPPSISFI